MASSAGTALLREIALTRESVCMGDDIDAPHAARVKLADGELLRDALHAIGTWYLAHVAGAPVAWRAEADGGVIGWLVRSNAGDGTTLTEVRGVEPDVPLRANAIHFVYISACEMPEHGPPPDVG